jgi:signal transduction histidine kinase/CHASE3 domain sensor protein
MSPSSAVVFATLGLGLAALPLRPLRWFVWFAANLTILIGGVSLIGYVWNASELVADRILPPVAITTAAAFVLLGIGALIATRAPAERNGVRLAPFSSVETKTLAGFLGTLFLLLLIGGHSYRAAVEAAESARWVVYTQQVRASLGQLDASISDANAQQRNYLLSGKPEYLQDYKRDADEAVQRAKGLAELISANPAQLQRLKELQVLIGERLAVLERVTATFEQSGLAAAQALIASGEGRQLMSAIHDSVAKMDSVEEDLLKSRSSDSATKQFGTLLSLLVTLAVAVAGFMVLYNGIQWELAIRTQAEDELRRSRAQIQSLFESLPGLYLVLTTDLKIVAASDAYLKATMTRREQIIGHDLFEVFPDNPAETAAADTMAIQKYDIRRPDGVFEERFWSPINSPLLGPDGQMEYIIHRVEDVTEFVHQKMKPEGSNAELSARLARMEAETFQSTQKVQEAKWQLEAVNKELESFSYSVSHDLRAPLRHIHGYVEMLTEATKGQLSDKAQRYLKTITDASGEMGQLIDDLLAFSRMGRTEMREDAVDLNRTVQAALQELEMVTKDRNIIWKIAALPFAAGDPSMLRQVFSNLIGNAVKYSRPRDPAEIEIGCDGDESGRRIYFVRDNGAGFDMKYAHKLFGVFQRLHRADEFEGTGIGLATVQRILTRHGDRIWAESAPDKGATFYFTLKPATLVEPKAQKYDFHPAG